MSSSPVDGFVTALELRDRRDQDDDERSGGPSVDVITGP